MNTKIIPVLYAFLAAIFYAINTPISKFILVEVTPSMLAGFLYLGAGIGIGILYIFKKEKYENSLTKNDLPFVIGMIVLDIIAPIFLMFGIKYSSAAEASLLENFEIVATSLIALIFFKENISKTLWFAIILISLSSFVISLDGVQSFNITVGSLLVLLATICWGFENNCTRSISNKNTYQIVILKGIFSGSGAILIALMLGETFPQFEFIISALILGFVSFGLSIFLYIRAQKDLGAAKTSAYYAITPFIAAFLSWMFINESLTLTYWIGLIIMIFGTTFIILDTLKAKHIHKHSHTFYHYHNGILHRHTIFHTHEHYHLVKSLKHLHFHSIGKLEKLVK